MTCECERADDTPDLCLWCEEPLSRYNYTGLCKSCQRERDREKAEAAADAILRALDNAGIWKKP